MDSLKDFDYFHDWNIDAIAVSDRHKLIVEMEDQGRRATLTFNGASRCALEHFSVSNNIIFDVKILNRDDVNYDLALSMLDKSERFTDRPGRQVALILATAGVEIAIEFDTFDIIVK
jgi:hypothetical protein